MRVGELIKAKKYNVQAGAWQQGRIPASAFQMRRNQNARDLGRTWFWKIIEFSALNVRCRILVQLHEMKQMCSFTLGVNADDGFMRIVCIREFHLSEPGWHCHAVLKCVDGVANFTHRELKRKPATINGNSMFEATRGNATALAAKFFCLDVQGDLL